MIFDNSMDDSIDSPARNLASRSARFNVNRQRLSLPLSAFTFSVATVACYQTAKASYLEAICPSERSLRELHATSEILVPRPIHALAAVDLACGRLDIAPTTLTFLRFRPRLPLHYRAPVSPSKITSTNRGDR